MTTSPTYGPVNVLADEIRYTTLAAVKRALGITDSSWDVEATQAIISLEVMGDVYCNRSFPDPAPDGEIQGIPEQVRQFALLGGMEVFKLMDAAGGTGGSDADGFVGVFDPYQDTARLAFNKHSVLLKGFRAPDAWGVV